MPEGWHGCAKLGAESLVTPLVLLMSLVGPLKDLETKSSLCGIDT